jgi:molybdopterin converting factor subunit 1
VSVNLRLFGALRELLENDTIKLEVEAEVTVDKLRQLLAEKYPAVADILPNLAFSVNLEFAGPDTVVKDGDEVALIPPVSGGRNG